MSLTAAEQAELLQLKEEEKQDSLLAVETQDTAAPIAPVETQEEGRSPGFRGFLEALIPKSFEAERVNIEESSESGKAKLEALKAEVKPKMEALMKELQGDKITFGERQDKTRELLKLRSSVRPGSSTVRSIASAASDVLSLPGRTLVAAIDKASGVEGFMDSLERSVATGESGPVSEFAENIIRAPDTFIGFMTGTSTAKIGATLAKKALTSPKAAKALTVLIDASQQGLLTSLTGEMDQLADGNEADLSRFIGNAAVAAGTEVGIRSLFSTIKGAATGTFKALKSAPEAVNIPEGQLKPDPQGFQATPAIITDDPLRKAIEVKAQMDPFLQDITAPITAQNFGALQKNLSGLEGVEVVQFSPTEIRITQKSPSELGGQLEESFRGTETGVLEKFKTSEAQTIAPIKGQELPQTKVGEKEISPESVKVDVATGVRKTTPAETVDITKNQSSLDIKEQLTELGSTPGKITGNERIGGATIGFLRNLEKKIDNAKTIENLIEQRRKIQDTLFRDKKQTSPVFLTRDKAALNRTYGKINERIAEQIKDPEMKQAWKEANRSFSEDLRLMDDIDKKVGFTSNASKAEKYIEKLGSKIGIDNIKKLEAAAAKDPNMKAFFDEVKTGFYNDFIKTTLKKDVAEISPDKFLTKWFQMPKELKESLIPPEVVKQIDNAHSKIMAILGVDASFLRGSRTAPLQELVKGGNLTAVKNLLKKMIQRPILKEYFKTGNFPAETVISFIGKTSRNKTVNNILKRLDKETDPKRIQFLTQRLNAEYRRILSREESQE